jgi:hypothetical protein
MVRKELVPEPGVNLGFDVGRVAAFGRQEVEQGAVCILDGHHAADPRYIDRRFELLATGFVDGRQRGIEARDRHRAQPVPPLECLAVLARVEDPAEVTSLVGDDAVPTVVLDIELPSKEPAVKLACGLPVARHQVVPDEFAGNLRPTRLINERRKGDAAIASSGRCRAE